MDSRILGAFFAYKFQTQVQGVSELIKCLYAAATGLDLHEETEGVET